MAKHELHNQAIDMRKEGASYSQIKAKLGISKSTLSGWLKPYPLTEERIVKLGTRTERQIERIRETKAKNKVRRLQNVAEKTAAEIGNLSKREILIAGLFLYWGEGTKTSYSTTSVSNTDPVMMRFFIKWLETIDMPRNKIRVRVQLYSDMNVEEEIKYWSRTLGLPLSAFRKPYIKNSQRSLLSYPQKFKHGTCNIFFHNRDLYENTMAGLAHIRTLFAD